MIKGDKIKLVKSMGVFDNIGEVCEVTNVSADGVITFKFGNGLHLGCMSYDEFQKYFELVKMAPKRAWTKWQEEFMYLHNIFGTKFLARFEYRHNGKKVQVRFHNIKAESTCSKYDEFNLETGLDLAKKRLMVKFLKNSLMDYTKTL